MPLDTFNALLSTKEVEGLIGKIGDGEAGSSQEVLQQSFDDFAKHLDPLKVLREACSNSIRSFSAAKNAKKRDEVATEKKQAQDLANKRRAAANATGKQDPKRLRAGMYGIFQCDFDGLSAIPVFDPDSAVSEINARALQRPFIAKSAAVAEKVGNENPCRLNIMVFKAGMAQNTKFSETRTLAGASAVRSQVLAACIGEVELVNESDETMQSVYIYGCKRGFGMISPEMKAASSCR
eukprot:6123588-Alexandrium_andersonii.AAC.1